MKKVNMQLLRLHIVTWVSALFLLFISFSLSGQKMPLTDKALDYRCSMKMDNLFGNVKEMNHYKQNIVNGIKDTLKLYRKTQYNLNGKLVYEEHYFDNGLKKSGYSNTFSYDKLNRPIKNNNLWINLNAPSFEKTYLYDDEKRKIEQYTVKIKSNTAKSQFDKSYEIEIDEYDSFFNSVRNIRITGIDTAFSNRRYFYNSFNQDTLSIYSNKSKNTIKEFVTSKIYNVDNKLITQISMEKDKVFFKRNITYNTSNKIISMTDLLHDSSSVVTMFNDSELQFEKRTYKKSLLTNYECYEYKLDKNINWIEKKIFTKNIQNLDAKSKLTSIETRVISYYE